MDITVQSYPGLSVVVAQGILSDSTFVEIEETFSKAPQANRKQVWLECTHMQSSTGTKQVLKKQSHIS